MGQILHGSATTTGAVRRAIQHSQESIKALANRYGINPKTVAKWKKRQSVNDLPTGPKCPRSSVLSVEEEAIIVAFRRHSLLALDDGLYALQPTIPRLTRSSLHRCLQRHGISRLPELKEDKPVQKTFKPCPIGYFHIEITDEEGNIAWQAHYKAWGEAKEVISKAAGKGGFRNPIRFQGQYFDHETGLHYNRFRYYDPGIWRFIPKDPIGFKGGINVFQYAPSPVEWIDPFGLVSHPNNSMATTSPSHRYVIVDTTTGELHKTGISSKPLNQNGTSGRANQQVNELDRQAGTDRYKAVVVEKGISRCQAARGEQDVFDKYDEHNKTTDAAAMPPGMRRPIPTRKKGK
jgi:RHS repeat-associated protein